MKRLSLVFVILLLCHSSLQDDIDDDVTVETEAEVDDVPYSSPTPSGSHYLAEHFDDVPKYKKRWVKSEAKKDGLEEELARYDGVWDVEAPRRDGLKNDLGLVLKSKAKHAAIAAKLDKIFTFNEKPLIVQYEVMFQEGQECGGAYVKLLSHGKESSDLRQFVDTTPYTIMFGPDKCGNDLKLHFIFRHQNPNNGSFEEKHCKKPKERLQEAFEDKKPHLYTLIVNPDNTFQIKVDHNIVNEGSLLEDFTPAVNPPAEIDDPNDSKPSLWDEREKIADPEATKPDDWDDDAPRKIVDPDAKKPDDWLENEPTMIPDPDAAKPADWDSDMDGEWEPPLVDNPACEKVSGCGAWEPPSVDNPAYKGKWRAPLIDNPNYQGKWKPRRIPNPDYYYDDAPFKMTSISAIGFELWSMSPAILFDNIIITDSIAVADDYASKTYDLKKRKIDSDSVSLYGKIMKSINYKPGWWTLYFIYCLIPVIGYAYYLYKRVQEESFLTSFLKYSNERPYLYGVYIILIGLPIALIVVFCCGSSVKDDSNEDPKKTDAYQPDDMPSSEQNDLNVPEDAPDGDADGDDEEEGDQSQEERDEEEAQASPSPRQRKTRKE